MGATLTFLVGGSMIWAAADAPNPVQSSLTGNVIHNADGSNTVVITGGHWNWLSHNSDCNLDRYAAGFAADWNDPNDPGYLVAAGIDVGSTKTGDNLVHWNTSGPRCGTFDWIVNGKPHPQGDIQSGILQHTYAAGTAIGPVCLVSYDVHGSTTPKDPIAGGSGHNGDNSIEKNNDVASGPGCFNIPLPKPQDLSITKTVAPSSVQVGQNFTYGLTVSNAGQVASSGDISVTDNVPSTLQVQSISGSGWNCPAPANSFTCSRSDSIPVNGSAPQIVVVAKALASAVPAGQQSGTVTNTGTVTNANDSNSANNQSTVTSTVTTPPASTLDVGIVKQASAASAKVGDTLSYTLTVRNNSTEDTTGAVSVTDTVPNGLRLDSVSTASGSGWTCSTSGSSLSCSRPSLGKGTTAPVINVSTTVLASAVPSGQTSSSVINTGFVSTPGDTDASNNQSSVTTPISTVPQAPLDLAIQKTASATSAKVGDQLGYTLNVTNVSGADTTGTVTVTDTVPASLRLLSVGGNGWTCSIGSSQAITCTRPSLAKGTSASISISTLVLSGAVPSVTNTGVVNTPGDSDSSNNTSTVTTPVSPVPLDVAIVKTASAASAKLGDTLTYTLQVTNTSTSDTQGTVTVNDTVPPGLSLQSVSGNGWNCSTVGQAISCTLASLAAGASANPITVTTTVLSSGAPQVTNTGTVTTPNDGNPSNNTSTVTTPVTVPAPKLAIVKSAVPASGTAVHRGDGITYTLSYSNDSDTAATGATITDDVPAGTTLDNSGTASVTGNTLTWTVDVPAHGSGSVSFSVIVNEDVADGAVIRNHAVMSYGGTPTTTNETQHPVSVPNGALSLVKSVDNTAPNFGDLLTYSLVVTATGNVTQTGVTVTDVVPNDTTYEGPVTCSTGCTGSYDAGTNTVTWDVGTMAPGSSVTVTFATRINRPDVPAGTTVTRTIDNVGMVFSNETPTTPSNHVRTPITAVLGVKIVKTPSTPTATLPFTGVGLPVGRAVTDGVLLVLAGMLMLALASGGRRKPNAA